MSTLYSPTTHGFSERLTVIDRAQVALLRELASSADLRLALKGGMAMRAVFGSMRLTKDIDFDRDPTMSMAALKAQLKKALSRAAQVAGLREPDVSFTKTTEVTVRARLAGKTASGDDARFDVEVSGRNLPIQAYRRSELVCPPNDYGIAPFYAETYSNDMLAAMKVLAVLADMRNVPRDIYDLVDLIHAGANPVAILAKRTPDELATLKVDVLGKLSQISYELAVQELMPYIPPAIAKQIDRASWEDRILMVSEKVEAWISAASSPPPPGEPGSGGIPSSTPARKSRP